MISTEYFGLLYVIGGVSPVVTSPARVREDLVRLVHRGADVREFAFGAARILARAMPFDGVFVVTMDPETLMPTGTVAAENVPPPATHPRLKEIVFGERHREIMGPHGFGDELRAVLVDDHATWGTVSFLRGADREPFSAADTALLEAVTGHLAEGLRRAVLLNHAGPGPPAGEDAAGVAVLAPDGSTVFTDEVAAAWIDELGGNGSVPPVVTAVATQARIVMAGPVPDGRSARARVQAASGRWLVVRGSVLGDKPGAHVAVTIEPARPQELAPLVADACGLTEREREVTRLVARGLSTDAIAARLFLSSWTVQDHLKAIFEKVGVATRGELVARVFFQQRVPQL